MSSRLRSSLRSRDSSSTSTGVDPRERIKDCCRKLVAFMCTQVGVGGLVVGYAIVGAMAFIAIEENAEVIDLSGERVSSAQALWNRTAGNGSVNVFDRETFDTTANEILVSFQKVVVEAAKKGYNGQTSKESWTIPAALMFCLSVFTMIGYGNLVPRTPWGRGATVVYAIFGIPLYVLYFLNMGKVLAQTFRWLYTRLHECTGRRKPGSRIIVPSTACLWVLSGYILAGTITFAQWEGWGYLDSAYFCVTSLCKIGIGDFVPGTDVNDVNRNESQTKLVINFVYLLFGLGLVAMCYNLMREQVRVKATEIYEDVRRAFEELRHKAAVQGYILAGTITFAQWEGWGYLDSAYFCVTSLCKIGIGDFVPGTDVNDVNRNESQTKLVINFVYLLFGLGLVAMCYNLMREQVRVKATEIYEDVRRAFEELRHKAAVGCCSD